MIVMKKELFFTAILIVIFWTVQGHAEMKIASIPDVNVTPSLQSVLRQKDNIFPAQKTDSSTSPAADSLLQINTNGYVLDGGNVIVDSLTEPKCVFYGNYNEGSGDAFQYVDIDTLVLNCQ